MSNDGMSNDVDPGRVPADLTAIEGERERIRRTYLRPADQRPPSSARGLHHFALVSSDVERTVRFYQDLLEFPLTDIFENRDYPGSNHFFFDIGHGNLLAFFDFPDLDVGPYTEVLGGLHHLLESKVSIYFRDPDGARLELLADPLGEMYGSKVL